MAYRSITLCVMADCNTAVIHLSWTWQRDNISIVLCFMLVNCGLQLKDRKFFVFMFAMQRTTITAECGRQGQAEVEGWQLQISPGLSTSAPSVHQCAVTLWTQRVAFYSIK